MEYQRAHPIQMIQSTAKYFFLLLLPVLRGLLFSGGDLTVWMDGAWFDLLIILIMVTLGYLN